MNKYWHDIVNRYFKAETTEEEERLLKRFLASDEAQGAEFDEARAVMGVFATARSSSLSSSRESEDSASRTTVPESSALSPQSTTIRSTLSSSLKWLSVAAAVVLAVGLWWHWSERPTYYACIDGVETTNRKEVVEAMHRSMENVQQDVETEDIISKQLGEMFNSIEE